MIVNLPPKEGIRLHSWLFNSPIGYSFLAYHQFAILIRLWPIFRLWGKYHQNVILTVLWSNHFVSGDMTGKTLCHMTQITAQKRIPLLKKLCQSANLSADILLELVCRWREEGGLEILSQPVGSPCTQNTDSLWSAQTPSSHHHHLSHYPAHRIPHICQFSPGPKISTW